MNRRQRAYNFAYYPLLLVLALAFLPVRLAAQEAGETYYVSAGGNDENWGFTEDRPLGTLHAACLRAQTGTVKKITVIGTLNETSESMSAAFKAQFDTVFACLGGEGDKAEITITGKPGAAGAERAALSAQGAQAGVLHVGGGIRVRLEHIEISGGEHPRINQATGIDMRGEETRVTLGSGAVVRGNQGVGILVYSGSSCVVDGGEIRDNGRGGVYVSMACTLTLRNGSIADNKTPTNGGGVGVGDGGSFTMSGGSITGNSTGNTDCYIGGGVAVGGGIFIMSGGLISDNRAVLGGGVFAYKDAAFIQEGGTVRDNKALRSPDIHQEQ